MRGSFCISDGRKNHMKTMKKLLAAVLATVMLLGVTDC